MAQTFLNFISLASKRFGDNFFAFSEAHHSSEPSSSAFGRGKLPCVCERVNAAINSLVNFEIFSF